MKRQLFAAFFLLLGYLSPAASRTAFALGANGAPPAAAPLSPAPASSALAMNWHNRPEEAFAAARQSGRPVLADLTAKWCGWCKTMEREVFTQPVFQKFAERFVLLRVDVEDRAGGSELQQRFNATSLPTLLILDGKRSLMGKVEGYFETPKLIARLENVLQRYDAYLATYAAVLAGSDAKLWLDTAHDMHKRGDGGRAATLLEKVVAKKELAGEELAWAKLELADAYRLDEHYMQARNVASELRKSLPSAPGIAAPAPIVERIDLLLVFIAGAERDCSRAAGALAEFEHGHPGSVYLTAARRALASLRSDNTAQCS
ncbi:MAG: thioredoxin family protein [Thermoanaerobaculia bacterium]